MKVSQVKQLHESLSGMMSKRLPIKMAFAIQKNYKALQEVVDFASEKQDDIVRKYAKRNDNGEMVQTEDGTGIILADHTGFVTDMEELMNADMPMEFTKISMPDIERCDEDMFDSLSPSEVGALEEMIEE